MPMALTKMDSKQLYKAFQDKDFLSQLKKDDRILVSNLSHGKFIFSVNFFWSGFNLKLCVLRKVMLSFFSIR